MEPTKNINSEEKLDISNKEYKFVAEMLWGGVPVDKKWAIDTKIFKDNYKEILNKYPKLDGSITSGLNK